MTSFALFAAIFVFSMSAKIFQIFRLSVFGHISYFFFHFYIKQKKIVFVKFFQNIKFLFFRNFMFFRNFIFSEFQNFENFMFFSEFQNFENFMFFSEFQIFRKFQIFFSFRCFLRAR